MNAKKLVALVLALAMMLAVLAACGGGDSSSEAQSSSQSSSQTAASSETTQSSAVESEPETASSEASTGEAAEVSILMSQDNTPDADNIVLQALGERTNTKIEWTVVPTSDELKQKVSVLAASDTLPDLFKIGDIGEGMDLVDGGLLYDLTGMEDKAPNFFGNSEDILDRVPMNETGLYVVPSGELGYAHNINLRKDWLDNLNLEVPTNLDELYEVYHAFTYDDPDGDGVDDTFALCANSKMTSFDNIFGAYGIPCGGNIRLDDGTVTTYAKHPHYLEAIRYIRKLISEGLVEPDWLTIPNMDMFGKLWNGTAGAIEWECVGPTNNWMPSRYTEDPLPEFCFPTIEGPYGDKGCTRQFPVVSGGIAVAANSKDVDADLRVMDYISTEEGKELLYLGVEGETFNWTDKDNFQYEFIGDYQDTTFQRANGVYVYMWFFKTKDPFELHTLNEQTQEGVQQAWDNMLPEEDSIDCQVSLQSRVDYGTDMDDLLQEMYAALLTAESDDELDGIYEDFISRWETEAHGSDWEQEITAWYNENNA